MPHSGDDDASVNVTEDRGVAQALLFTLGLVGLLGLGQAATASQAHQPTATHQAAVRHAGHRLGARASNAISQSPAPQTTRPATCVAGLVVMGD